jgi:hypothetical protein
VDGQLQQAAVWRNAVALSWSDLGQPIKTVQANTPGEIWRFSVNGRSVTLDWTSGVARLVAATMPTTSPSSQEAAISSSTVSSGDGKFEEDFSRARATVMDQGQ